MVENFINVLMRIEQGSRILYVTVGGGGRELKDTVRLSDFLPRRGIRRSSSLLGQHNVENTHRSWMEQKFLAMAAAAASQGVTGVGAGSGGLSLGCIGTAEGTTPLTRHLTAHPAGGLTTTAGGEPPKISGIPCAASPSRYTAPVHIDVGGVTYTSSLGTLTRHPDSRLGRLFNGSIPIVLDTLKQHYFIDRDGNLFRHILNYLRCGRLVLPNNFHELDLLREEAKYYDIPSLSREIEELWTRSEIAESSVDGKAWESKRQRPRNEDNFANHQCILLSTSPDLGERVLISGERHIVEESFPEVADGLQVSSCPSPSPPWLSSDCRHLHRFPLNGFSKLQLLPAVQRLLDAGFILSTSTCTSTCSASEGGTGREYLFVRKPALSH
ncbi:BTB/POZ domain-containing protein kctd15-like isoform X2 [Varroa destructor]|uniref:BTB domain-containing protein n=1 Tax=Varroa destructor TaxID=109461 RepID=A0A7M7JQ83_VARDE|nr:BTB/POZ domain-containing protein kctd15-like isoform X2 [Varroa destructor]XP_022655242.1 BTB/POZ domain-containing protein kctd15-like isoform X2 [Varroa destructor]